MIHSLGLGLTSSCSPKNLTRMRDIYSKLPEVKVEPLYFASEDLNSERLLAMMKVDQDARMFPCRFGWLWFYRSLNMILPRYASLHGIYYVDPAWHGTIFVQRISSPAEGSEIRGVAESHVRYAIECFGFVSPRRKSIKLRLEPFQEGSANDYRVSDLVSHFRSAYTVVEACPRHSSTQLRHVGSSILSPNSSFRPKRRHLES